jgi:hypothetical protein
MTIKTQNGKVITKDGKVSCGCCEGPPTECCLYPIQPFIDELYGFDDLPDEIDYGEVGDIFFTLTKQPAGTIDPFDGKERIYFAESDGELYRIVTELEGVIGWTLERYDTDGWGPDAGDYGQNCLIGPQQAWNIFDKFADTYIIDFPFFDFASQGNVVTRTSLGRWEGTATFFSATFPLILSACLPRQLDIIGWAVSVEFTDPGGDALADPHTYDPETSIYISRPNTPVGNYVLIGYDPSFGLVVVS